MNDAEVVFFTGVDASWAWPTVRHAARAALAAASAEYGIVVSLRWAVRESAAERAHAERWGVRDWPGITAPAGFVAVIEDGEGAVWVNAASHDDVDVFAAVCACVSDLARRMAP